MRLETDRVFTLEDPGLPDEIDTVPPPACGSHYEANTVLMTVPPLDALPSLDVEERPSHTVVMPVTSFLAQARPPEPEIRFVPYLPVVAFDDLALEPMDEPEPAREPSLGVIVAVGLGAGAVLAVLFSLAFLMLVD